MTAHETLAHRFDSHRAHLHAVALRMLGSPADADDAVQEAWLRLSRSDTSDVGNLGGWLTTVVARICLDQLRSRDARREDPMESDDVQAHIDDAHDPAHDVELADSLGAALLIILDTLTPAERLAFVLHDMFAVSFDQIATMIDRTPAAARQLASRGRRRVQGASAGAGADLAQRREVVSAFLAASREGKFDTLLALLHPDVMLHADGIAVTMGAAGEVRGADAVARTFAGRAKGARLALLDGVPGLAWQQAGRMRVAFAMTIDDGRITAIELIADPERLTALDVAFLRPAARTAAGPA
ncbi:MAG: sigma-70 family RNA polymerase sigma factor [Gemmatimonadaceae bacterium]